MAHNFFMGFIGVDFALRYFITRVLLRGYREGLSR